MNVTDVTGYPRHDHLVALIGERGYMGIEDLAQILSVSTQTVRRDIRKLADKGLVSRHHGGAGPVSSVANIAFEQREISLLDEKTAIANAIADFLPDGCTVFITIGTTVEHVARALGVRKNLRVITDSIRVATILYKHSQIETMVPGGSVRPHNGGIVGPSVVPFIQGFRADYVITSMGAIDPDGTILEFNVDEAEVAKTMIAHSRHLLLAADHTKFHSSAAVEIGNVAQAMTLFTDERPAPAMQAHMKKNQVELRLCK